MALIDTLHTIIEAESGTPPAKPTISRDVAGRILATLDSLGFEIKRKPPAQDGNAS